MARLYRATSDDALRDKAARLMTEWAKTVKPGGDCGMRHYVYDKLVCGLVDMHLHAGRPDAVPMLEKTTEWASRTLERQPKIVDPGHNTHYYGLPQEWYTLSENHTARGRPPATRCSRSSPRSGAIRNIGTSSQIPHDRRARRECTRTAT
jgi:hypothetical protein